MKALRHIEDGLARFWWVVAIALLVFSLACSTGCRFSRVLPGPDGQPVVVYEGTDIAPGVSKLIGDATGEPDVVADTVGSIVEAVEGADVDGAISDASTGNWLGLVLKVAGVAAAAGGAYAVRRKVKARKNVA